MTVADPRFAAAPARLPALPVLSGLDPATVILLAVAVLLSVVAGATAVWGLVALTMTALVAVPLMFVVLIRITRG